MKMERFLSFALAFVMVLGMMPWSATEVDASSNIVINGVDIGYAVGDYFTYNGYSCGSCHGRNTCPSNPDDCNCIRYWPSKSTISIDLAAVQCYGFAHYCQWAVYGSYSVVDDITGDVDASACTENNIKTLLNGCAPATHIRVGTGDGSHSLVVVSTSDSNISIVECNVEDTCQITSQTYTWADFATYLKRKNGITFTKECTYGVDTRYSGTLPITKYTLSSSNVTAYSAVQGNSCGSIYPDDPCVIESVFTNGWCKVKCPWTLNGINYSRTVFVPLSVFGDIELVSSVPADLGENFTAPILNKEHWKIIENSDGIVQTANETGTAKQLWRFERQSDGSYKISSCEDGRCLDVANASNTAGAKIWMVDSNDTDAQRWYIYEEAGGYVLKAKCTDCVLDLPNNDPTNGNQLQMYTKNGTGAQIWAIYRGEECTLKAPTLSVHVGDAASATIFTWTEVYGERCYDIKIWKDKIWEGDAYHVKWGATSGYEIVLPAGTYQAYVDAGHYFEGKMSNVVTFTVEEHKHSYTYKRTERPTVKAEGMLVGTCSSCGETITITLPKLNTTDYTFEVVAAPSCTAKGIGRYTWNTTTYGTYYFDVTISNIEHSYSYAVTKAPTTSATGVLTGTCSQCSGTTTVTLPKLNTTDYTYKVTKAATCTADGTGRYTWKTTTYGSFYFDVTISKTGHSYSYKATKSPTTFATGTLTGTCAKCSGTTTVTLPKLNTTDYTYKVTKEPSYTATGTGRYTWKTTTYGTFYFEVTLDKLTATLAKVEIASNPAKTVYEIGESLDTAGLTLKATYSDGSTKTVTSGFTTSGFDSSTAGEKTVTVSYGGKSTSFKVNVEEVEEIDPNVPQIIVSNSTGMVGQQVNVTISLENNPGIASMMLSVGYDADILTLVSVTDGGNLGTAVHSDNYTASPYTLTWANDLATENYTYNGEIVTLTFEVAEDAELGQTPVTVYYDYDNFDIFNVDGEEVRFEMVDGSVKVIDVLIGDVNSDGKVNTQDRMILTRYLAKWTGYTEDMINMTASDVNCDGKVNTQDRMILTRYLAKWNGYETLPYTG